MLLGLSFFEGNCENDVINLQKKKHDLTDLNTDLRTALHAIRNIIILFLIVPFFFSFLMSNISFYGLPICVVHVQCYLFQVSKSFQNNQFNLYVCNASISCSVIEKLQ